MNCFFAGRRLRALYALVLLLPVMSGNAALCALCASRHFHHTRQHTMTMDMGPGESHERGGCGGEVSDGTCPGPQVLVMVATLPTLPEVPVSNASSPVAVESLRGELHSASLPQETPPPRV